MVRAEPLRCVRVERPAALRLFDQERTGRNDGAELPATRCDNVRRFDVEHPTGTGETGQTFDCAGAFDGFGREPQHSEGHQWVHAFAFPLLPAAAAPAPTPPMKLRMNSATPPSPCSSARSMASCKRSLTSCRYAVS